jgi:hypothetical protein
MTRIRNRLKDLRLVLALAAMAPLGFAHAQGFNSVSSGTPDSSVAAPSGAGTAPDSVAVLAANSAVARTESVSPLVASPPTAGNVASIAAFSPTPAASAGTASVVVPASTGPAAPVAPRPEAFVSGSGSFGSVSGSAPSLPAPPPANASHGAGSSSSFEMAEKVVVIKHERVLRLLRRGRVIAEYPIKLGLNPYGHKQREGDFRTPEGNYELVLRNPKSEFFLSIRISYPNREDVAVAHESGFEPGGLIMIHGQPNEPKRPSEYYATRDWTDGCIALSNADMVDVWLRTTAGIPIEIRK